MNTATNGAHVSADQRYTASRPCPVCKGHEGIPKGRGERCVGYITGSGKLALCERVQSTETVDTVAGPMFKHRLRGDCPCGTQHAPPDPLDSRSNGRAGGKGKGKRIYRTPQDAIRWAHEGDRRVGKLAGHWVYHDAGGRPLIAVYRFDSDKIDPETGKPSKEFRPVGRTPSGWVNGDAHLKPYPLYHLPDLADAELVVISEGEKATDAVKALGLVATTSAHGAGAADRSDWAPLAGKTVAILPDADEKGECYAYEVRGILDGLDPWPTIKVVNLPGLGPKGDAFDWVQAGGTRDELLRLIAEAPALDPLESPPSRRPVIICDSMMVDEGFKKWTPKALDALVLLNRKEPSPVVYQRATQLARIRPGEGTESPGIEPLGLDALRGLLDRAADWGSVHHTKEGPETNFGPPRLDVCKDILALPGYGDTFPLLELIAESPRFLPDGSLILRPGYHKTGHIFYAPTPDLIGLEVPARVTDEDLEAARSLVIDELLVDFPFANQASRANAFALFLLPFARLLIDGPTPDHHVEASTEGTGKGLLAQACLMPSVGSEPAFTTPKEDDAEWRKLLTTVFMRGASYLILDNMANVVDPFTGDSRLVDSPSLASALTGTRWIDRKLGGNTEVNVLIRTVFASTGNNVEWSRELRRRLAPIQLLTPCEDPSTRTGFRHDPLLDWVRGNRRELVRAALVLIRRWFDDGCPEGRQVMGSFERYGRVMGGILGTIGVDGFLGNRKTGSVYDRERARWAMLTEAWAKQHATLPVRAKDLVDLISGNQALSDVFADIIGEGSDLSKGQRMGRAIRRNINRVCGDWRIIAAGGHRTANVGLYKLCDPKEEIEGEDEGEESDLPF